MVLVEHDQVPVDLARPLVLRLDAARLVRPEEVLERPEAHDRTALVRRRVLLVQRRPARVFRTRHELPALEVDVRGEVLVPRRLHRRLEREDEYLFQPHPLRELVRGERLPETHLRVPEELRGLARIAPLRRREVRSRPLHGVPLFPAHREILRTRAHEPRPVPRRHDGGPDGLDVRVEPLARSALDARVLQERKHGLVEKRRAVRPHRALHHLDAVDLLVIRRHLHGGDLLPDAHLNLARRVTDLEPPLELWMVNGKGVYLRLDPLGPRLQQFIRNRHLTPPSAGSSIQ